MAHSLWLKKIPFVVSAGFDPGGLPASFALGTALRKPYHQADLERAIIEAMVRSRQAPS